MQRDITMHGVDFTVEFEDEDVIALYIGNQDVTDVIDRLTRDAINVLVARNAERWVDEYNADMHTDYRIACAEADRNDLAH